MLRREKAEVKKVIVKERKKERKKKERKKEIQTQATDPYALYFK